MKWIIVMIVAGTAAHAIGGDQSQVEKSKKEAAAQFPELGDSNSQLNKRFLARTNALKVAGDEVMTKDDWPLIIARELAWEMNILSVDERIKQANAVAQMQAQSQTQVAPKTQATGQLTTQPAVEDKDSRKVDGFIVRDIDERSAIVQDYVYGMIVIMGAHGPLGEHIKCVGKVRGTIDVPWFGSSKMMSVVDIR